MPGPPPWRRNSISVIGTQLALRGCSDRQSYRDLKAPSPDSSEDSEETSEEESAREPKFTLRLRLQPSVHDEALIVPIVRVQQGGPRSKGIFSTLFSTYLVLAVNAMLQFIVTSKVGDLTGQRTQRMESRLWSLCKERDPDFMPFSRQLDEEWGLSPQSFYFSCGPLTVTMMSRMRNVDRDGDGLWTYDEAVFLERLWEADYAKKATLALAWKYFARAYREDGGSPQGAMEDTAIPMAWMEGWQNETDLCIISDVLLCGNLEARDILRRKLGGESDADSRIARCEELITQRCPKIFGQVYGLYRRWSTELCGGVTSTSWLEAKGILTVDYNLVLRYVKDHDSIVTEYYFSLLVVILLIWVMCMLGQLRVIVDWWLVLIAFPTMPKKEGVWVEETGTSLRVWAIPWLHKLATLILNLLPRTLICIYLSQIGSSFLIRADDYDELIQNGVALGFLIETDNMLFVAVSREEEKDMVNACQPLTTEVGLPFLKVRRTTMRDMPVGIVYTMLILGVTFGMIYHEYTKDRGKLDIGQALRCLCHASGKGCVAAQILGGYPSVTDVTAAYGSRIMGIT